MLVVLLRHAHRLGMGDTGLSGQGQQQSQDLATLLDRGEIPKPTRILTSPKRRARETIEPLASVAKLPIKSEAALDERIDGETPSRFQIRVSDFWDHLSHLKETEVVYLCSHLDWLEASGSVVPNLANMAYENARPILISFNEGKWNITAKITS